MNNKYTFTLTTETPVSIGNGNTLSPLADYIRYNGQIYFIDKPKFEKYLLDNNLIDFYTKKVFEYSGQDKEDFLAKEVLKGNFRDYCKSKTIDAHIKKGVKEVRQIVHNAGNPYIPGSTIKGAIKTALLYNWLVSDEDGIKERDELVQFSNEIYKQNENLIENLCELKSVKPKEQDRDRINKILKKLKDGKGYQVRKQAENIIKNFLDLNHSRNRREFSNLIITDSEPCEFKKKAIFETNRINIKNKKINEDLMVLKEALKNNISTEFSIKVNNQFTNKYFRELNSPYFILDCLDYYSYSAACFEHDKYSNYKFCDENSNPLQFYKKIITDYDNETEFAYLILGSGKTYLENSIGLAIADSSYTEFDKFVKITGISDYCQKEYPTTRTLTTHNNLPLGWVKIHLKE